MPTPLAVTSSDQAAGCLRRSGVADEVLAWFDPLHIGPVPVRDDLATLSNHRAAYFQLQSFGFSRLGHDYYAARNAGLAQAASTTDVIIVFQDNLLDQLQQLQVLDVLGGLSLRPGRLLAVHVDGFIDELTEAAVLALGEQAIEVTAEALELGNVAWDAFRQPTPEAWADLAMYDTTALPFLARTIKRALEELPSTGSGLSRSQRQILELLKRQNLTPRDLFQAHFSFEPKSHLEDWVFYTILDGMADGAYPLVEGKSDITFNPNMALIDWRRYMLPEMKLTSYGQAVLRGEADDRQHNGTDHWWGGTRLTDGHLWRWDPRSSQLVAPGARTGTVAKPPTDAPVAPEASESAA
jgi:hypothetical protein